MYFSIKLPHKLSHKHFILEPKQNCFKHNKQKHTIKLCKYLKTQQRGRELLISWPILRSVWNSVLHSDSIYLCCGSCFCLQIKKKQRGKNYSYERCKYLKNIFKTNENKMNSRQQLKVTKQTVRGRVKKTHTVCITQKPLFLFWCALRKRCKTYTNIE